MERCVLEGAARLPAKAAVPSASPRAVRGSPRGSASRWHRRRLTFGHADSCAVASPWRFDLYLPCRVMWSIFSYAYLPPPHLLYEASVQAFCPSPNLTIFLLLNFKSSLHVLDNGPSSDVVFAGIFSQRAARLLVLSTSSFARRRIVTLMRSSLSVLSFKDPAFGVASKRSPRSPRSSRFYLAVF